MKTCRNTAISSSSGGYQGIGFAIPVNLAKWVSDQLVETGSVQRAFLGVTIQSVTPELARQFGGEVTSGAAITGVLPDTPSAEAGLKARRRLDGQGNDETQFLTALHDIVASGQTPAEDLLALYHGRWGGQVDPVFAEFQY